MTDLCEQNLLAYTDAILNLHFNYPSKLIPIAQPPVRPRIYGALTHPERRRDVLPTVRRAPKPGRCPECGNEGPEGKGLPSYYFEHSGLCHECHTNYLPPSLSERLETHGSTDFVTQWRVRGCEGEAVVVSPAAMLYSMTGTPDGATWEHGLPETWNGPTENSPLMGALPTEEDRKIEAEIKLVEGWRELTFKTWRDLTESEKRAKATPDRLAAEIADEFHRLQREEMLEYRKKLARADVNRKRIPPPKAAAHLGRALVRRWIRIWIAEAKAKSDAAIRKQGQAA